MSVRIKHVWRQTLLLLCRLIFFVTVLFLGHRTYDFKAGTSMLIYAYCVMQASLRFHSDFDILNSIFIFIWSAELHSMLLTISKSADAIIFFCEILQIRFDSIHMYWGLREGAYELCIKQATLIFADDKRVTGLIQNHCINLCGIVPELNE